LNGNRDQEGRGANSGRVFDLRWIVLMRGFSPDPGSMRLTLT